MLGDIRVGCRPLKRADSDPEFTPADLAHHQLVCGRRLVGNQTVLKNMPLSRSVFHYAQSVRPSQRHTATWFGHARAGHKLGEVWPVPGLQGQVWHPLVYDRYRIGPVDVPLESNSWPDGTLSGLCIGGVAQPIFLAPVVIPAISFYRYLY